MFIKKNLHKDYKKRVQFQKCEFDLLLFKFIYKNKFLDFPVRLLAYNLALQLKSRSTVIHNFCIETGRSRGIIRKYRLSRIVFRNYCNKGILVEVHKV